MEKEQLYTFRVSIGEAPSNNSHEQREFYNLVIKDRYVSLCDATTNDIIMEWPYCHIRRYGKTPTTFSVDAGRKSVSGEGVFEVQTKEANLIMASINEKIKRLLDKGINKPPDERRPKESTELPPPCTKSELSVTESHSYINMKPCRGESCQKRSSYGNAKSLGSQDKETVSIDQGQVTIGAKKDKVTGPKASYQPCTSMTASTTTLEVSDNGHINPPTYVNAPTETEPDSSGYITAVHQNTR